MMDTRVKEVLTILKNKPSLVDADYSRYGDNIQKKAIECLEDVIEDNSARIEEALKNQLNGDKAYTPQRTYNITEYKCLTKPTEFVELMESPSFKALLKDIRSSEVAKFYSFILNDSISSYVKVKEILKVPAMFNTFVLSYYTEDESKQSAIIKQVAKLGIAPTDDITSFNIERIAAQIATIKSAEQQEVYSNSGTSNTISEEVVADWLETQRTNKATWKEYISKAIKNSVLPEVNKDKYAHLSTNAHEYAVSRLKALEKLYKPGFEAFSEIGIVGIRKGKADPILYTFDREGNSYALTGKSPSGKYEAGTVFTDFSDKKYSKILRISSDYGEKVQRIIEGFNLKLSNYIRKYYNDNINILVDDYFPEDFEDLSNAYLVKLHLALQSAKLKLTSGDISIRKWLRQAGKAYSGMYQQVCEGKISSLMAWKDVSKWIIWVLESYYFKYADKCQIDESLDDMQLEEEARIAYESQLDNGLKHIFVLVSLGNSEFEVRGLWANSLLSLFNSNKVSGVEDNIRSILADADKEVLKAREASKVSFENLTASGDTDYVLINYKQDKKPREIFAIEALEQLEASGRLPSWSNCLLGMREDPGHEGELYFWKNFNNSGKAQAEYRAYALYAGSRSGKGVMTNAILSSAIASGIPVFYTDGKPENGPTMGRIAWREGKEAYVFDGRHTGLTPFEGFMEDYTYIGDTKPTNGSPEAYVRSAKGRLYYNYTMPEELFQSMGREAFDTFLGVSRYLRSLSLFIEMGNMRAGGGALPEEDFQLWVFDEMSNMSALERQVRQAFASYCKTHGVKKEITTASDGALIEFVSPYQGTDEGVKFINKWSDWTKNKIEKIAGEFNKMTFGKTQMNLLMIFQEPIWLQNNKDATVTTIAKFVTQFGNCTKIIGKNAIQNNCGYYGSGQTSKKIKEELGKTLWAITDGDTDLRNYRQETEKDWLGKQLVIFNPFKTFGIPYASDQAKIDADPTNRTFKGRYFSYYIEELQTSINALQGGNAVRVADILSAAAEQANDLVLSKGLNPDVSYIDPETKKKKVLPAAPFDGIVDGEFSAMGKLTALNKYIYNFSGFTKNLAITLAEHTKNCLKDAEGRHIELTDEDVQKRLEEFKEELFKFDKDLDKIALDVSQLVKQGYEENRYNALYDRISAMVNRLGGEGLFRNPDNPSDYTLYGYLYDDVYGAEGVRLHLEQISQEDRESGQDYSKREALLANFDEEVSKHLDTLGTVVTDKLAKVANSLQLLANQHYILTHDDFNAFIEDGKSLQNYKSMGALPGLDEPLTLRDYNENADEYLLRYKDVYYTLCNNFALLSNGIFDYIIINTLYQFKEDIETFLKVTSVIKGAWKNADIIGKYRSTLELMLASLLKSGETDLINISEDKEAGTVEVSYNFDKIPDKIDSMVAYNALVGRILTYINTISQVVPVILNLNKSSLNFERQQAVEVMKRLVRVVENNILIDLAKLKTANFDISPLPNNSIGDDGVSSEEGLQYDSSKVKEGIINAKQELTQVAQEFSGILSKMKEVIK